MQSPAIRIVFIPATSSGKALWKASFSMAVEYFPFDYSDQRGSLEEAVRGLLTKSSLPGHWSIGELTDGSYVAVRNHPNSIKGNLL